MNQPSGKSPVVAISNDEFTTWLAPAPATRPSTVHDASCRTTTTKSPSTGGAGFTTPKGATQDAGTDDPPTLTMIWLAVADDTTPVRICAKGPFSAATTPAATLTTGHQSCVDRRGVRAGSPSAPAVAQT